MSLSSILPNPNEHDFITLIDKRVPLNVSISLSLQLVDENKVAIPSVNLKSLTFSLYNVPTSLIINNKSNVNILNVNGGSVDTKGNLIYNSPISDSIILDANSSEELHFFSLNWTYSSGTKSGKHLVYFYMSNLEI